MEQTIRRAGLDLRNPTTDALQKVASLLRADDKKGIWLAAPSPLAIDEDRDQKIWGFDFYDSEVRGRRFVSASGVIVATRLESRETFADLVEEPKEPADPGAAPDTRALPRSESLLQFTVNLRERLGALPWRAGNYLVDVILDSQTSNRLHFQIRSGAAAEHDPVVAAFIDQQRATTGAPKALQPAPGLAGQWPNYRKSERSVALPAGIGVALAAERVSVYRPGAHSILRGSFRLPVPAAFYLGGAGDGLAATAAVPITLVMTGNLMTGPFVVPLRVASYDRVDRRAVESTVTGYFEVDLFALPEASKVPQTYTIWAYAGETRSAPATAAIVSTDMLK